MNFTTCPYCKMRVLPKADGTCPSCQADISQEEKGSILPKVLVETLSNAHPKRIEDNPREDQQVCQRCKQREGKPYLIYYGKVVGKEKVDKDISTDVVEPVGSESVFLCDRCIHRNQLKWIIIGIVTIFIGGPLILALLQNRWGVLICITCVIVGIGIIYEVLKSNKEEAGSGAAEDFRTTDLAKQGYDKVWTPASSKYIHFSKKPDKNNTSDMSQTK